MQLDELGFTGRYRHGDRAAIIVGPNGSGKSNHLRLLARIYRGDRPIAVVSNTAYDRFSGMRLIEKLTAGRSGPKAVIKRAVMTALDRTYSSFKQISAILEYCGYEPRFGFRIDRTYRELDYRYAEFSQGNPDAEEAFNFLRRTRPGEMFWIDAYGSSFEFSRSREFATVLRFEKELRREKFIEAIPLFLQRSDGTKIELLSASSGELSLISTLIFLSVAVSENSLILIDEPENSLHPAWQSEYFDKLMTALAYRNASIVIATHAPLIVTGALAKYPEQVGVYQIQHGRPAALTLDGKSKSGIEEILWRAFDVVTPANHFVSEEIVEAISNFERGRISKDDVLTFIDRLDEESFDAQQQEFFVEVRKLVDKVEARVAARRDGDAPIIDV